MEGTLISSITREEWIAWRWIEVTIYGDTERRFLRCGRTTQTKAAQLKANLDSLGSECWMADGDG